MWCQFVFQYSHFNWISCVARCQILPTPPISSPTSCLPLICDYAWIIALILGGVKTIPPLIVCFRNFTWFKNFAKFSYARTFWLSFSIILRSTWFLKIWQQTESVLPEFRPVLKEWNSWFSSYLENNYDNISSRW